MPGLKCGTVFAGTTTPWPVFGLRPVRLPAAPDAEAAEAPQLDLVAVLQGLDDRREDGVDDDLGVLAGEGGLAPDLVHELGLGHRRATPPRVSFWAACCAARNTSPSVERSLPARLAVGLDVLLVLVLLHGADREADLLLALLDLDDLHREDVAGLELLLGLVDALLVELGDVDQALDALRQLDEGAEGREPHDLALDDVARLVVREVVVPHVGRRAA